MTTKPQPTHAELLAQLHYDPATGQFTRLAAPARGKAWNTRYAGKAAGCIATGRVGPPYLVIWIEGRLHKAHRLAWLYVTGEWPSDDIDHENLDGLDNRWENLREATKAQNNVNRRAQSNNMTGFKGVCFNRARQSYRAQICVNGKTQHLGCFESPEKAHLAYVAASQELHGRFGRTD